MDFSTISRTDPDYSRKMMQKHLSNKKRHLSQSIEEPLSEPSHLKRQNFREINEEEHRMRKLCKEQIQQSLEEYKKMKTNQHQQETKTKMIMAKENGLLDYMEDEIRKRNKFIENCLLRQDYMKNYYINDDARKNKQILTHIDLNYDKDIFNHESDRYLQQQRINQTLTWMVNSQQKESKQVQRKKQLSEYGKYFEDKYRSDSHNPIINPKEYHIENKYVLRNLHQLK